MSFDEYSSYDGLGLADLVRRKEVSPGELVEAAIERVEKLDGQLNAVVYRAWDEARRVASGPLPDGPFRGVPLLIKDLWTPVAGMPRTSGSRFLATEVTPEDGELTRRYRAAGVVILGKTNTPEFGITGTTESAQLGACRNPWNPDHIAGGSSGGAAASAASGMVPMAHGGDGLGSIRIPAACCGLFGMKPTRDRNPNSSIATGSSISTGSGLDYSPDRDRVTGMAVDHVLTRSVRDSAAMLDATGYPEADSPYAPPPKERPYLEELTRPVGRLRIAFSSATPSGRPIDGEVRSALEDSAALLQELGHDVFERDIELDYRRFYRAQGAIGASNSACNVADMIERMGREPEEHEFEPLTWAGVRFGRKLRGQVVMEAWRTQRTLSRQILRFFDDVDVLLTPVMGTAPPRIGHIDPVNLDPVEVNRRQARIFPFTPPFNTTGQPGMSVPLAWSADGLPIGMQFVGRYGDEATLFRLAGQLEEARPWRDRRPAVWG